MEAGILHVPSSFSPHCQEGYLALNCFNASKLKEQWRYWQLLSKIMKFSSTTHSSSLTNQKKHPGIPAVVQGSLTCAEITKNMQQQSCRFFFLFHMLLMRNIHS